MKNRNNTGLKRLINATIFSLAGLRAAWHHEAAFREELILIVVVVPTSFWLGTNAVEFVDENYARNFRIIRVTPVGFGLRLNAARATENTDATVEYFQ